MAALVPKFCKTAEEWAREPFYKAVARLTRRFLELDHQAVRELL